MSALSLGVAVLASGSSLLAQPVGGRATDQVASVTIDFLSDGRCAVAASGAGFRSSATYRPDGAIEDSPRRCAIPPIPVGRHVSLVVTLPAGASRPGDSVPPLDWNQRDGSWIGTASLATWPDAVVVAPASRPWLPALAAIAAGLLLVIGLRSRRRRRTGPELAV